MSEPALGFPFAPNFDPSAASEPRAKRLHRLRHSTAHIMAEAVVQIFPDARVAIGPPIAHGFYYDFDLPRPLTPEDLRDIEKRMDKICGKSKPFEVAAVSWADARAYFESQGQGYKLEILDRILARAIAHDQTPKVSLYRQGEFTDLCAGPHVDKTSRCRHFKLLSVSAAYWRGDTTRPMLQRIYGTAWDNKEDLQAYLHFLEEAKRRNHKRLGEELDLYSFHTEAPGACFWHPRGVQMYLEFQKYWREIHARRGYVEIMNPILYKRDLYVKSGHWDHYRDNMFIATDPSELKPGALVLLEPDGTRVLTTDGVERSELTQYCLKPMNCPDTFLFYNSKRRSFRELPLRVSEGGLLHRYEMAGVLNGLFRVRQFMQDDAHIFVTEEQVAGEIKEVLSIVDEVYALFGMQCQFTLSTRPEAFMGEIPLWDKAEAALEACLDETGRPYDTDIGGGAFYGPKIDIKVKDCLGRLWQCATVQVDFQQPINFDMGYWDTANTRKKPIVIHRAIFGSFERFIGVLLEHTGGPLPTWLAPVQAVVIPITDKVADYANELTKHLISKGIRAELDDRNEKMNYKIREAEVFKVPYQLVVGQQEADARTVSLRTYREGQRGTVTWDALADEIAGKIARREFDVEVNPLATFEEAEGTASSDDGADEY